MIGRRALSLAALLLVLPAALPAGRWDTAALVQAVGRAPHPPVSYTETRVSAYLDVPLVSHGELHLLPDGTLVKERESPHERVDIGPERVRLSTAEGEKELPLARMPALRGLGDGLRALLRGDLVTLERLFQPRLQGARDRWVLTLVPRDPAMAAAVASVRVGGVSTRIATVQVLERDGDSLLMELATVP
jgi:hypothetical protein